MPNISEAQIDSVQFNDLNADPDAPDAGRIRHYFKDGLPYFRLENGDIVPVLGIPESYIHLADEKSSCTLGGTFTSGAWQTRDLNQEKSDAGGYCTLSSNQFILAAGTYRVNINAPAFSVGQHQARLTNLTAGIVQLAGQSNYATAGAQTSSVIVGRFTIAVPSTFEVQHFCGATQVDNGFGVPLCSGVETYTIVELWKE